MVKQTLTKQKLLLLRWAMLDTQDRLKIEMAMVKKLPWGVRFLLTPLALLRQMGITLSLHLVSLPIYVSRTPQLVFDRYARRQGETYLDSYAVFQRAAKYTIAITATTIVAAVLAVTLATFLRSRLH